MDGNGISQIGEKRGVRLTLHPLFFLVGVWYAFTGELLLFLLSCFVAVQHECAHAFAAAKLGYKLNKIVLMPFGAVIDSDLRGISLKDEITVALWGPLCNLFTAAFFVAVWWCFPTAYAYTDTACFASLSIALVNLLPAYPLDGGRVLRCILVRLFLKKTDAATAEKRARNCCFFVTLFCAAGCFLAFGILCLMQLPNFTLLIFGLFLLLSGLGNGKQAAVYAKMDFSFTAAFARGAEIKRVAVLNSCPIKNLFKYLTSGAYTVFEVYDAQENHLFDLPQNELSARFLTVSTPYVPIGELYRKEKTAKTHEKPVQNNQKRE